MSDEEQIVRLISRRIKLIKQLVGAGSIGTTVAIELARAEEELDFLIERIASRRKIDRPTFCVGEAHATREGPATR